MIIPIPIFFNSAETAEYTYPVWVTAIFAISLLVVVVSLLLALIGLIFCLWDIFDEVNDYIINIGLSGAVIGVILMIVAVIAMAVTGVEVT